MSGKYTKEVNKEEVLRIFGNWNEFAGIKQRMLDESDTDLITWNFQLNPFQSMFVFRSPNSNVYYIGQTDHEKDCKCDYYLCKGRRQSK